MKVLHWGKIAVFGLPILLILSLYILTRSSVYVQNPSTLSTYIILDLLVTMPAIYFLLIRKKNIPKITVLSVFVVGMVTATFILPVGQQDLLSKIKMIAVPLVEIGVFTFLFLKTRATIKAYKSIGYKSKDFFTVLKEAARSVFSGMVGTLLATEIAVIYYGLLNWRSYTPGINEFTYHRKSGIIATVYVFIGLVVVETFVAHYLLMKWNNTAAWIATLISAYSMLQIVALMKSMSRRLIHIDVEAGVLYLRYGFFTEATIPLIDIDRIEATSRSLPEDAEMVPLTPLGILDGHNLIIHCHNEHELHGFYGRNKMFMGIGVYIDEKSEFTDLINKVIESDNA